MEVIDPRALYGSNYDEPRNVTRRALDRALRDMHVLRDEFADTALGSLLIADGTLPDYFPLRAAEAYQLADEMLKAKFDSMTWSTK